MLLSICIPTHEGRCSFLEEAIGSIISQLTPDIFHKVEICISDNASQDGTTEVIAEFKAKYTDLINYYRNETDTGAQNFHNVIEIAHGDWCWFLGSDDQLEVGAVIQVLQWIEQNPNLTGITVDSLNFDKTMSILTSPNTIRLLPSNPKVTRLLCSAEVIMEELAIAQTYMSTQIFRRQSWLDEVQSFGLNNFVSSGQFPHTLILTRMILRNPVWMWGAQKIVKSRTGNQCLGEITGHHQHKYLLETLDSILKVWDSLPIAHNELRAKVLKRYLRYWLSPGAILFCKEQHNHNKRNDRELLQGVTRLLKHLPIFWLRHFIFLLLPHQSAKVIKRLGIKNALRRFLKTLPSKS